MALRLDDPDPADVYRVYRRALADYPIPEALHDGLVRYLVDGIRPDPFLNAVLENDLWAAVIGATPAANVLALPALVRFLAAEAPPEAWGSPERVAFWCAARRSPG